MLLQPVILSGGSGTRLWPLSREHFPKQLLSLVGACSMLQDTLTRLNGISSDIPLSPPLIVCNEEHRFLVAEQMRQINVVPRQLILEPFGRNTAPALTLAAFSTLKLDEDCILLAMPADHVITNIAAFQAAVQVGYRLAQENHIVAFGIIPARAEVGYGYIQIGQPLPNTIAHLASAPQAFTLKAFVEKPDQETAQHYLESAGYLWNSGMFMLRASAWIAEISNYAPEIEKTCYQAISEGVQDGDFFRINRTAFVSCPHDSIDYAVMEKLTAESPAHSPAVIPLNAGWSDVGSWPSLLDANPRDENGNMIRGDVLLEDIRDTLVLAEHRMVAAIGLKDLMIIETADAVLVVHKEHAQNVKNIVTQLKREGREEHIKHQKVYRPWGYYESIDFGHRFQVKRIMVNPGASLSLQMHHHRAEHWIVVTGTARVIRDDEIILISENQSTYIPLGVKHRLENPGKLPLEIIEIQSGSYLAEDDIIRFDDHYGRAGQSY
ncbi:mannose-1-phosphate guanylyltransferase/mannose-6-phosphate isomerase [Candidatus Nitrosoglobus terrae]|uniref:mannose-1-phosphate guanylyltransferase n=1 Tax=Candidatus Nitrosoglobus terrae TaxID=1630141 RepID=A0A1Q2SP19_9GAMM|nr:mannose-1-phosphate guanylyltransferase/mannose-6-phosphate isomerase [Candidatus Nitrosoglobus terrae]BAW80872.1 mannose-1-phosphate guanylyltransferase/mannose-6-phosphate isomerase [Candidatus Nitrosoglobus terrae]